MLPPGKAGLIESKSMKLYLAGFNQSRFGSPEAVLAATREHRAVLEIVAVVRHALLHPSSIGKLIDLRRRATFCGGSMRNMPPGKDST